MIDNIEEIKKLLHFDSEDDFYFLNLILRKKDIPDLKGRNNSSRCVKNYYISSLEYLDSKYEEIKNLCEVTKARACINLNRRSYRSVGLETLGLISGYIRSNDFSNIKRAWDSACGNSSTNHQKIWIVDIDEKSLELVSKINDIITKIQPTGDKKLGIIETRNGYHLITKPFNRKDFATKVINVDIQPNNPTILYIPNQ